MEQTIREDTKVAQEERVISFLRELRSELNDFRGERFVNQHLADKEVTKEFAWEIVAYLHRTWDQQNWNIDKDSGYRILEGTALYLERFSDEKDKLMLDVLRKSLEKLVDDERKIHALGTTSPQLKPQPMPQQKPVQVALAVETEDLSESAGAQIQDIAGVDAELRELAARGRRI